MTHISRKAVNILFHAWVFSILQLMKPTGISAGQLTLSVIFAQGEWDGVNAPDRTLLFGLTSQRRTCMLSDVFILLLLLN